MALKRLSLLVVAATLALLVPSAASAGSITDFAIFGVNNVFIAHGSNIQGWVGSNNTVSYVEGTTTTGSVRADSMVITGGNVVTINGDIRSNANVQFSANTTNVHGTVYAPSHTGNATVDGGFVTAGGPFYTDVTPFPLLQVNSFGGNPVDQGAVAPGAYGTLENDLGNLTFSAGNYGFTQLFKDSSNLSTWTMDVSGGDIWLYFANYAFIQAGVTVNVVGGSANQVHWQTPGFFKLDGFNNFAGQIIANDYIQFDHHNTLTGSAWSGNYFTSGEAVTQINPVGINKLAADPVPEPATLGLLGLGLLGLAAKVRRVRARKQ